MSPLNSVNQSAAAGLVRVAQGARAVDGRRRARWRLLAARSLNARQFAFSWLLAFMFFLSLCLGALFLVMVHHLFDAGWSVPIRRFCEHLACLLFPWMAILFLPIAILRQNIYAWMSPAAQAHPNHALQRSCRCSPSRCFIVVAAGCFRVWWLLSKRLRSWSLKQDETGAARAPTKCASTPTGVSSRSRSRSPSRRSCG